MIINISPAYLNSELKKVGIHPASNKIFGRKAEIIPLKAFDVPAPGANILKQEMLSLGGDAVVHKNVINCNVEVSDVILLGTRKHYNILLDKLKLMPYFGLGRVRSALKSYFETLKPNSITSPWGRKLTFDRPRLMGIINISPDSFYAGSRKQNMAEILETAAKMVQDGVDVLDLGAMSTRPGSDPVDEATEYAKIIPAVAAIRKNHSETLISVDTYRARIAQAALDAGADIINDISGFGFDEKLIEVVVKSKAPYILMHIKGTPKDMQTNPTYADLIKEIMQYFANKIARARDLGVPEHNIIIDPGLGFGKTYEDNMEIMDRMSELKSFRRPLLIGASRKSFVGTALALESPADRLEGTLAITALCAYHDVDLIRVHDVRENARVIKMVEAIKCRRR